MKTQLDDFTRAYIACALWSSTDEDGTPLDDCRDESDVASETLEQMILDCSTFQETYAPLLERGDDNKIYC